MKHISKSGFYITPFGNIISKPFKLDKIIDDFNDDIFVDVIFNIFDFVDGQLREK